jgi:hypothetical protein
MTHVEKRTMLDMVADIKISHITAGMSHNCVEASVVSWMTVIQKTVGKTYACNDKKVFYIDTFIFCRKILNGGNVRSLHILRSRNSAYCNTVCYTTCKRDKRNLREQSH